MMKKLIAILVLSMAFAAMPMQAATLYFTSDLVNSLWSNADNWWLDSDFTTPATRIPAPGDIADLTYTMDVVQVDVTVGDVDVYGGAFALYGGEITDGDWYAYHDGYASGMEVGTISGGNHHVGGYFQYGVTISGGVWSEECYMEGVEATISGGTFYCPVVMYNNPITGGTFYGAIIGSIGLYISGGTFHGRVEMTEGDSIDGGTFHNLYYNSSNSIFSAVLVGSFEYAYPANIVSVTWTGLKSLKMFDSSWMYLDRGINGSAVLGMW